MTFFLARPLQIAFFVSIFVYMPKYTSSSPEFPSLSRSSLQNVDHLSRPKCSHCLPRPLSTCCAALLPISFLCLILCPSEPHKICQIPSGWRRKGEKQNSAKVSFSSLCDLIDCVFIALIALHASDDFLSASVCVTNSLCSTEEMSCRIPSRPV